MNISYKTGRNVIELVVNKQSIPQAGLIVYIVTCSS